MKPVKIFLGDLTYDTVSLSTDSNPLNIGYIGAYCKNKFGADVEISLFKYISDLEKALYLSSPDIVGLSNYCWCERIGLEMFKLAKKQNPDVINVWGGPNFPSDRLSQREYLTSKPEVDIYIPLEGEIPFSNIVERLFHCLGSVKGKNEIFAKPVDGCIIKGQAGELLYGDEVKRLKNLDEMPSPYLEGLLDEFFDGRLNPLIQTSRGCPFSCTFCVDGSALVNKVNKFSIDRVRNELTYIAEHVPTETETLGISDLNFGMYSRDLEICDAIVEIQELYGYPRKVSATTGKNAKEKIAATIQKLNKSMRLTMSVQSLDATVLDNIRRQNISSKKMLELAPVLREANLRTTSEVILGLPGDTHDSHVATLRELVNSGMDYVQPYTLMLLNGSELAKPQEREKWEFLTKFRVLPRDFVELRTGKKVVEIEEVVVGSNSLTFEEYVQLRKLALLVLVITHGVVFDPIQKYLRHYDIDIFELSYRMLYRLQASTSKLGDVFREFEKNTKDELWDSAEAIEKYYQNDEAYKKLINGEEGFNVLQVHHAEIIVNHIAEMVQLVGVISRELLRESNINGDETEKEVSELVKYCNAISYQVLKGSRSSETPIIDFQYNIPEWLTNETDRSLAGFRLDRSITLAFNMDEITNRTIDNALRGYGDTTIGRAQVIKRVQLTDIWRKPSACN